jgi:hypothetical protein
MSHDNLINADEARRFLELYHRHAQAAQQCVDMPGVVQLCSMAPNDRGMRSSCYLPGDLDYMLKDALIDAGAGKNVFAETRLTRSSKFEGERGKAESTICVFAVVTDLDNDRAGKGGAVVGDPSVVVETSPGNFQAWYFVCPVIKGWAELNSLREIVKAAGGDACTGVVTQPFRVPGLPNLPTQKKIVAGRVPCMAKIVSISDKVFTVSELKTVFSAVTPARRPNRKPVRSLKQNGRCLSTPPSCETEDCCQGYPRHGPIGAIPVCG